MCERRLAEPADRKREKSLNLNAKSCVVDTYLTVLHVINYIIIFYETLRIISIELRAWSVNYIVEICLLARFFFLENFPP